MVRKKILKINFQKNCFKTLYYFFFSNLRTLKVLTGLSNLFPAINVKKQTKNIKEWRPSKAEIQESFFLHVKVSSYFSLSFFSVC